MIITDFVLNNVRLSCHVWLEFCITNTTRNSQNTFNAPTAPINNSSTQVIYSLGLVISSRFVVFAESNDRTITFDNYCARISCITANDFLVANDSTCTGGALWSHQMLIKGKVY
jgi:hypothetical protein